MNTKAATWTRADRRRAARGEARQNTEAAPVAGWHLEAACDEGQSPYSWHLKDHQGNEVATFPDTTSETERNLIAATPALVEALEASITSMESIRPHSYHETAIAKARAALELAGGGK